MSKVLPAFVVAAAGVGLAWLGYRVEWWWPVVVVTGLALVGWLAHTTGRQMLAKRPLNGMRVMEWRFLMPLALAAGGAGLAIGLGVWLEPGENASVETKKLLAATFAALTAFIAAVWLKSAEEAAVEWVGRPIEVAFKDIFRTSFEPDTGPANAVFDEAWQGRGWATTADRRARAREVAAGLAAQPSGGGST